MPPLRPPHRRQALAELQAAVGSVARPNPVVFAWRWRYELTLAAVTATCVIAVPPIPGPAWVAAGCAAVIAAAAALWPRTRRQIAARAWCVITAHRVRAGCAGAWIHSRGGKLPAVLLTTRQPFGERVRLWCHAGTCAQDFEAARELLTAACWAQDTRVTCHPRHRQLVTLDVIRHSKPKPRPGASSTSQARPAKQPPPMLIGATNQPAASSHNGHGQPTVVKLNAGSTTRTP